MNDNEKTNIKLTTWEVLRYKFPAAEYVLLSEVSDASGYARSRSLDYMLINLWQSRGLAITGIERKSNRGDWLKELKNPQKQENHFKHCDYFYLITDKENVAKIEEIPDTWGWYHVNEKSVLKTMKQAPKLKSLPVDRGLLCAMLRRAANKDSYVHVDSIESTVAVKAAQLLHNNKEEASRKGAMYDALKERVDLFEKESGVSISRTWDLGNIAKAVSVVASGSVEGLVKDMQRIELQVKNIYTSLSEKVKSLNELPVIDKNKLTGGAHE